MNYSRRLRSLAIFIPLVILGAGCSNSLDRSVPQKGPYPQQELALDTQTKVCALHLYSGREDEVCWKLSAENTTKLISMVQSASATVWVPEAEPGLGYKGLIIFLPASNDLTGRPMTQVSIFNGKFHYNKDETALTDSRGYFNEPNPHFIYKLDQERKIEAWLLLLGRPHISPDVYKALDDSWNQNVTGFQTRKTVDGIDWKSYINTDLRFSIQYPPDRQIAEDDATGVSFSYLIPESHESISFKHTTASLEEWFSSLHLDPAVILKKQKMTLAGMPALRVDTTEMGRILIAAKRPNPTQYPGEGIYVTESSNRMIENGMLNTLKIEF